MTAGRDILFLSQRIPYPPDKGDKVRSWNILRHLAKRHRVHLGAFVDDPDDWQHTETLASVCATMKLVPLKRPAAALRCLGGLLRGTSLTAPYYADRAMERWVAETLRTVKPAAAFAYSSASAQFLLRAPAPPPRFVMDFVDVDSDKWRQYAATKGPGKAWLFRREADRLLAFDRAVAARADACLFVSEEEADLFRRLAPEAAAKTQGMSNGVDCAAFDPGRDWPDPYRDRDHDNRDGPVIAFTGLMDYWPNVEAVVWFADHVLPALRRARPGARFAIVGGRPAPEVQALADRPGVIITGRVADIQPYMAHADALVTPLSIARGIQNKVLEGMAMARPLVTSPQALEGIEARPGHELLLAERTPEATLAAVLKALEPGSQALGRAARLCVERQYSWPARLAPLERLLLPDRSEAGATAGAFAE